MTRCKFTQREIEEDVFREYIASSSDEDVNDRKHTPRNKLRDLLLGSRDEIPEGWDQSKDDDKDCIDMEITFTPSLGNPRSKTDETTLDRYQRKTKEKRKKRKEYKEALKASKIANDFSQANDGQINKHDISKNKGAEFDIEVQNVELIVPHHFDLDAILKAEGTKKYDKGKSAKKGKPEAKELQEDFAVDVHDKRFSALHEDHTFAIDPSNPQYVQWPGVIHIIVLTDLVTSQPREWLPSSTNARVCGESATKTQHRRQKQIFKDWLRVSNERARITNNVMGSDASFEGYVYY